MELLLSALHLTMAERVFQLPEIVGNVLSFLEQEIPTLQACLTVNKIFFSETIRVLWKMCCCNSPSVVQAIGKRPTVQDLAALYGNEGRRQMYANCVCNLSFLDIYGGNDFKRMSSNGPEADLLTKLADIAFPRLKTISIQVPVSKPGREVYSLLKPFLQSNIRSINVDDGVLCPEFFVAIKNRCPKVISMDLRASY